MYKKDLRCYRQLHMGVLQKKMVTIFITLSALMVEKWTNSANSNTGETLMVWSLQEFLTEVKLVEK